MKINKKYAVLSALAVLVVAIGVFVYTDKVLAPVPTSTTQQAAQPQTGTITLSIDGLYSAKPVAITKDQTMLGVLQALNATDPRLQLSTKVYAGMGTLINGLNGATNGTGKKYWQYKVNGILPQIGADQYKVQDGDKVEWFFGASQE